MRRINLIEHEINYNACHRNIKPERKRPARDSAVLVISRTQTPPQRNDDEGDDDDGKERVRNQNDEIDWTNYSFAFEPGWALPQIVGQERMIKNVRDEKDD